MANQSDLWTDEFLVGMRQVTDPLADDTVAKILASGQEGIVNQIFSTLRMNADLRREDLPEDLKTYFGQASALPEWADPGLLRKGEQFFAEYGVEVAFLLFFQSLPLAYSCGNGAQVLHATGRLEEFQGRPEKFTRRLMETAQFVFNVGTADGFGPTGVATESAMKVRLMHACIRYFIKRKGNWDTEKLGEPINQEDMAGTMLSFSALVYEGMDTMGLQVDPALVEGHYHLWKVVGHLIGLRPEMIPETAAEGHRLGHKILDQQRRATPQGKELTAALLGFAKKAIPGRIFDFLPEVFIRFYCGDPTADALGIRNFGWFRRRFLPSLINFFIRGLNRVEHLDDFTARIGGKLQLHLLQHVITQYYHHKEVDFYLPPSLRENWPLDNIAQ